MAGTKKIGVAAALRILKDPPMEGFEPVWRRGPGPQK